MTGANWAFQLHRDVKAFQRARTAIERRIVHSEVVA
jgi:hypothetical protein